MGERYKLTDENVGLIRTSNLPDSHFAKLYNVDRRTIRLARIGRTYKNHPVPPQTQTRPRGPAPL